MEKFNIDTPFKDLKSEIEDYFGKYMIYKVMSVINI